jgi:hypothetical protein
MAAFILVAGGAAVTPFVKAMVTDTPTFLPMYGLAMVIISFLLSILLLIKGSIEEQAFQAYSPPNVSSVSLKAPPGFGSCVILVSR